MIYPTHILKQDKIIFRWACHRTLKKLNKKSTPCIHVDSHGNPLIKHNGLHSIWKSFQSVLRPHLYLHFILLNNSYFHDLFNNLPKNKSSRTLRHNLSRFFKLFKFFFFWQFILSLIFYNSFHIIILVNVLSIL